MSARKKQKRQRQKERAMHTALVPIRYGNGNKRVAKAAPVESVVLAQPHRRGATATDQRRENALGRLLLDGKVTHSRYAAADLYRAGELFADAHAAMRLVLDSRRPYAVCTGSAREIDEEEAARIQKHWGDVTRALRDAGPIPKAAVEVVLIDKPQDERILAHWIVLSLSAGLGALAQHFGLDR
jgi:hypothetical protein